MKKLCAVMVLLAMIGVGSWAQTESVAETTAGQVVDPAFIFMSFVGPFSLTVQTYKDYDGSTQTEDVVGTMKVGCFVGPRVFSKEMGSVYAVLSPYALAATWGYEVGTGIDVLYLGKPIFLGIELPLFASGMDNTSGSEVAYTASLGDFHTISAYFGVSALYQAKTIFGKTKTSRLFAAFKLGYTDPGDAYYKYTTLGILFGGTL